MTTTVKRILVALAALVLAACSAPQRDAGATGEAVPDSATGSVSVEAPGIARISERAVSTISIVPRPGSEMTMGYPYRLDVTMTGPEASESVTLRARDAEELTSERVVFLYDFTPESAGIHRIEAELDFSVCTGPTCTPKTVRFDWSIAVAP